MKFNVYECACAMNSELLFFCFINVVALYLYYKIYRSNNFNKANNKRKKHSGQMNLYENVK